MREAGAYTVTASAGETVRRLQIAANATLSITGGAFTAEAGTGAGANAGAILIGEGARLVVGRALDNSGLITLDTGGGVAELLFNDDTTLSGGGHIDLGDGRANLLTGTSGNVVLTNVDNTLFGSGRLGSGRLTLLNRSRGVIDARGDQALILNTSGRVLYNDGLIEGTGAGGLTIKNTVVFNGYPVSDGVILAADGSKVRLRGAAIFGGTLESTGSGKIVTGRAGVSRGFHNELDGRTYAVHNQAGLLVADHTSLAIQGEIHNTGRITLGARGHFADLIVNTSNATLTGGGSVRLRGDAGDRFYGAAATATLTNVDNRIGGGGLLGHGVLTLVNQAGGVIVAGGASALIIDTGTRTLVNAGIIKATGPGGGLITSAVDNTGTLKAAGGDLTVMGAVTGNGSATIRGATLAFGSNFTETVGFTGATGVLELARSQSYAGKIKGFSLTGGTSLGLRDIGFTGAGEASFSGDRHSGVLTVSDGIHTAHITLIATIPARPSSPATTARAGSSWPARRRVRRPFRRSSRPWRSWAPAPEKRPTRRTRTPRPFPIWPSSAPTTLKEPAGPPNAHAVQNCHKIPL
ncbi:MAG: hypothetical protein H0X27_03570 [Caulobacteraceae bacterium]|nr:hypothetical protein [Caulobacteraceae bacterium]